MCGHCCILDFTDCIASRKDCRLQELNLHMLDSLDVIAYMVASYDPARSDLIP